MDFFNSKSSSRLEGLTDAIYSIIATVMILPIAHTELPEDEYLGPQFAKLILPQLLVYTASFLLICNSWSHHVTIFMSVSKVDDVVVLLNLAMAMAASFYPFTFTLLGQFYDYRLAIILFCLVISVVGIIELIFIAYVFKNTHLLKQEVQDNAERHHHRNYMFASVITPVVLALLAAALANVSTVVANLCLLLIIFSNFLRRLAITLYKMIIAKCRRTEVELSIEDDGPVRERLLDRPHSKERVECFSDGVYAIVATLIILDICEDNIPRPDDVASHGGSLAKALNQYLSVYLAYFATFSTVALLAYVQHSLLHLLEEMNKMMVILNNLSLLCIGMTPLAFRMATEYNTYEHRILRNETLAIQINCVLVFATALFLTALWVCALFYQEKFVKQEGHFGSPEHVYMCAKLAVFPFVTFLVYCISLGESVDLKTAAFFGMEIGCLGLFIVLHIVFVVYKRKYTALREGVNNSLHNISAEDIVT